VNNLKGKILIASMIAALAILVLSPATHASTNISVYGYTDKTNYNPGDTVTVTVFIYEAGTDTINLINVTVVYPWYSIIWGGNQTISAHNYAISTGGSWNFTATFTIPTDGRASIGSGSTTISYYYKVGSTVSQGSATPDSLDLHINSVPFYMSLANMGTLITVIMVQAVLLIISALIIAAAVFLSKRRPKAEWKEEAKE
jgi:hypothetical protein